MDVKSIAVHNNNRKQLEITTNLHKKLGNVSIIDIEYYRH